MNQLPIRDPPVPRIRLNSAGLWENDPNPPSYVSYKQRAGYDTSPTIPEEPFLCASCGAQVDRFGRHVERSHHVTYGNDNTNVAVSADDPLAQSRVQRARARKKAERCPRCRRPGAQCNCRGRG